MCLSWLKAVLSFCEMYQHFITPVVSLFGAVIIMIQIRSTVKLNRKNMTFEKIKELENFLYHNEALAEMIQTTGLLTERGEAVDGNTEAEIMKKDKYLLYQLLNYFESLSLAVFEKNIDQKILFKIYGRRLQRAYIKLHPFIVLITADSPDPRYKPYQHFDKLYDKLKRYFWREKTYGKD